MTGSLIQVLSSSDDGSISNADRIIFSRSKTGFRDVTDGATNMEAFNEHLLGDGQNVAPASGDYVKRGIELSMGTQTTPSACNRASKTSGSGNEKPIRIGDNRKRGDWLEVVTALFFSSTTLDAN